MSKTKFCLILLVVVLLPILLSAKTLKFNFYGHYSYDFLHLNTNSTWNPNAMFVNSEKDSRLAFNLESRVHFKSIRVLVSPVLTVDHNSKSKLALREATLNLSFGKLELTAGRAIIKFGTGYMFTPIGIVTPGKQVSDPEDFQRGRVGGDLVKLDYYTENFNLSATVFKKNNWQNVALFAYGNIKGIDVYGILYYPEYHKLEYGFAVATTIGDAVEVHAEAMMFRRAPVLHHLVYFADQPGMVYPQSPLVQPQDGYYKEFLLGTNITVKQINIIAEYYHNDWGLKKQWWSRLKTHFDYNLNRTDGPPDFLNVTADLEILAQSKRGLFRDYLFLRAWKSYKNVDLSTIFFVNLADGSFLSLLQLDYSLSDRISAYIQPLYFSGKSGSEFGASFYASSLQIGFRLAL